MTVVRRLIVTAMLAIGMGAFGISIIVMADESQNSESSVAVEISAAQVEVLRSHLPPDMEKSLTFAELGDRRSRLNITYDQAAELELIVFNPSLLADSGTKDRKQLIAIRLAIRDAFRRKRLDLDVHPRILEQRGRVYRDNMKTGRGDIIVRGVIVDANGKALNDVRVEVDQSMPSTVPFGKPTHKIVVHEDVHGKFEYRFPNAYSVSLSFETDGYYPTNLSLTRGLEQGLREGQPLTRDVRVVLYRVGELTALTRVNGTLRHRVDGSGAVFSLAMADKSTWPRRLPSVESFVHVEKIEQAVKRAPSGFSAVALIAPDGLVEVQSAESPQWPGMVRRMPQRLELQMHGQEDGFVRFEPPADEKMIGRDLLIVERMMPEAPDGGYERSLVLNAEDLAGIVFAYFKIQGHYGKAVFTMQEVPENRKGVEFDVFLWIQPDGSRNVAGK